MFCLSMFCRYPEKSIHPCKTRVLLHKIGLRMGHKLIEHIIMDAQKGRKKKKKRIQMVVCRENSILFGVPYKPTDVN